jgi:hypothetical protein
LEGDENSKSVFIKFKTSFEVGNEKILPCPPTLSVQSKAAIWSREMHTKGKKAFALH